jgi:hypothetical protein
MRNVPRCTVIGAAIAAIVMPSTAQGPPSPVLRYEMDVSTKSGFGAGMRGMAGAMSMMMDGGGGGDGVEHSVALVLGSTRTVSGTPRADHFFLPAVRLGKSVPLTGTRGGTSEPDSLPGGVERPKGRVLLFWGCGAKAGPGQPMILDFAKLGAGQMPAGLPTGTIPPSRGITSANSRTRVGWPALERPKPGSSLIGAHRIAGNLGPDISFSLAQDYMDALSARTAMLPDGSISLRWTGLPTATGYAATAIGGMDRMANGGGDIVWWTSSATRDFGNGLSGWLSPATVATLITRKQVMPPTQTSCQLPAEFKKAAGDIRITMLNAFGPEANFAYPPRPPGDAPWNPEWTAKVRFRAETTLMAGLDMPGMAESASEDGDTSTSDTSRQDRCKPKKKRGGLGGMLGGALGGVMGGGGAPAGC